MKSYFIIFILLIIIIIIYLLEIIIYDEDIHDIITYNQLQKRLKKGDILFSHGTNILSYIVSITNNSKFSHVIMATDSKNIIQNLPVTLYNIKNKNDVDICSLTKFINNGYINKLYYLPISDNFNKHIDFDSVLKDKYSFSIYQFMNSMLINNDNIYDDNINHHCSSTIAKIIKKNISNIIKNPIQYTPKELFKDIKEMTPYYDKLYEVKLNKYNTLSFYKKLKYMFMIYDESYI
jgi:hypothetical protein